MTWGALVPVIIAFLTIWMFIKVVEGILTTYGRQMDEFTYVPPSVPVEAPPKIAFSNLPGEVSAPSPVGAPAVRGIAPETEGGAPGEPAELVAAVACALAQARLEMAPSAPAAWGQAESPWALVGRWRLVQREPQMKRF